MWNNGDRNIKLAITEYLDKIKSYLKDIINNLKKIWYIRNSINNSNWLYVF